MRRTSDWIALSLVLAIAVIAGTEYLTERATGMSSPAYVYKVVVTAERPTH